MKTAVVTGAAQGIGFAIARALLRDGHRVVAVDVAPESLTRARDQLAAVGEVVAFAGDVSQPDTIAALKAMAESRYGTVDILVNNAGISPKINGRSPRLEEITLDEWNRTFAVNVAAMMLTCQAFLPGMRTAGWGRVINLASLAGRTRSLIAGPTYSASKAAVIGLTRAIAAEYAPHGITVNSLTPGRIDTPMAAVAGPAANGNYISQIPVGRMGTPEEIAAATVFLASDGAAFITGVTLDINGGYFMA